MDTTAVCGTSRRRAGVCSLGLAVLLGSPVPSPGDGGGRERGAAAASEPGAAGRQGEPEGGTGRDADPSRARISLAEAILAAERRTGGRAVEAEIEDENGVPVVEVELLREGRRIKVVMSGDGSEFSVREEARREGRKRSSKEEGGERGEERKGGEEGRESGEDRPDERDGERERDD